MNLAISITAHLHLINKGHVHENQMPLKFYKIKYKKPAFFEILHHKLITPIRGAFNTIDYNINDVINLPLTKILSG